MGRFDIDRLLDELERPEGTPAPTDPAPTPDDHALPANAGGEPSTALSRNVQSGGVLATQGGSTGREGAEGAIELASNIAGGQGAFDERLKQQLVHSGVADARQIQLAESVLRQSPGVDLVSVLVEQGVNEQALQKQIAVVRHFDFQRLPEDQIERLVDPELVGQLGIQYCQEHELIPMRRVDGRLVIGTSHPDDVFALDDVRLRLNARSIRVVVIPGPDIRDALHALDRETEDTSVDVDAILSDIDEDDVQVEAASTEEVDLEREAAESPVIRYVNYIIQQAVKEGASDIHIEPGDKSLKVRFRIDGILFDAMQPPPRMSAAITSRLKIMANLDISERRMPQDGRIRCSVQGRKLDLRMSTLPNVSGEKTVMRILDQKSIHVDLDDLGFGPDALVLWKKQISQPHGIVLVTGPTGSGKTTTLYASLRQMDKKSLNISTVEDPVEYHMDGVTQTQMHERIGFTFASALRALLRQDPDVIMLGEIRDIETATIAIQASLTGHLVLSTLHTNDAPSAVTRLGNIGVEGFLIGAAINAVLAQRLVRRICSHCKAPAQATEEMLEFLTMQGIDASSVFAGQGCERCRNIGYSGRAGIYEMLVIDDHMRDVIARTPNVSEFRRICIDRGMVTLREDGFRKVR
ncbi:MAG: Flp pilus assembly complex ATPase component TadA, partial [Phycisphaerales bacterium]|nr:Flp pilus assembly complex ATPase component TadA [Phycisphaerales bacterium]